MRCTFRIGNHQSPVFFLSQNQSTNVYLYFKQNPLSITDWKMYFLNETLNWNSNFHSNSRKLTCEWLLSFRSLSRFVGLVYNKLATSFRDNRHSGCVVLWNHHSSSLLKAPHRECIKRYSIARLTDWMTSSHHPQAKLYRTLIKVCSSVFCLQTAAVNSTSEAHR